ncbi:MAG: hypothetical protein HZC01_01150 [Candidatus Kerfeldbacteria bacterium]|nr:hypothetical protein [Candidatus Kerfeldbacteria bacterium]
MKLNQSGVSTVTILTIIIVIGVLVGGGFFLLNQERSKTRDAKRMADMARLQAAFEMMFNNRASYGDAAINGCATAGDLVSACNLSGYLSDSAQFKDPGGGAYTVTTVPSELTYQVTFSLENAYGNYAAGQHTLSPEGIQ